MPRPVCSTSSDKRKGLVALPQIFDSSMRQTDTTSAAVPAAVKPRLVIRFFRTEMIIEKRQDRTRGENENGGGGGGGGAEERQ